MRPTSQYKLICIVTEYIFQKRLFLQTKLPVYLCVYIRICVFFVHVYTYLHVYTCISIYMYIYN